MSARVFVELDNNLRTRIEALIETLIDVCDQLDGDADREDDDPAEDSDTGVADHDALELFRNEGEIIGRFAENLALKYRRPALYRRGSFHKGFKRP